MYLNPRRPTFLAMELRDETAWGYPMVKPLFKSDGSPQILTDSEAFSLLPLDAPLSCHLFKLVTFNVPMKPWYPCRKLTIQPLDSVLSNFENPMNFWKGKAAELAAEQEREKKRKAADHRRREREKGEQPKRQKSEHKPAAIEAEAEVDTDKEDDDAEEDDLMLHL